MAKGVRVSAIRQKRLAFAVAAALVPFAQSTHAQGTPNALTLPTGGNVTAGTAVISHQGPGTMQIDQASDKAILQWQSFSIGSAAWVNFTQPSASSIALNRVMGTNPSQIFGRMTANGQVFLSNPNGVLFAPGASVDVGALFATTLSISDGDFLAGRYNFSNAGNAGSVVNRGVITASSYAALAGPQVRNDGVIVANSGTVALAAGNRVALDMVGDGLISVSVDQAAMKASALNSGTIQADGGRVILTARSANALLDTVVNNTGIIRANSLVARNGEIILDGGTAGVVANSGTIQAASGDAGTSAGTVTVLGGSVSLSSGSKIDATGAAGGGAVTLVGGAIAEAADAAIATTGTLTTVSVGGQALNGANAVSAFNAANLWGDISLTNTATSLNIAGITQLGAGAVNVNNSGAIAVSGAIATHGAVTLAASGSIAETAGGAIATTGTLTTSSAGGQAFNGTNAVGAFNAANTGSGDISLTNTATSLNVTGISESGGGAVNVNNSAGITVSGATTTDGGAITLSGASLTNLAAISNGGGGSNTTLQADAFNLAGGTVNGGHGAVILRPRTGTNSFGIESPGATTVTNADIASITTSDFIVFGSGLGTTFTGNMIIGANNQVNGGSTNLAFFRSTVPGGSTTLGPNGVFTTGNLIVSAGGGSLTGTGIVAGNQIELRANAGIGNPLSRVNTEANTLAINSAGSPAFVNELDDVTLGAVNLTVGGIANNIVTSTGKLDLVAGGTLTLNAAGTQDAIVTSVGGQTITANGLVLHAQDGRVANITNNGGDQTIVIGAGGMDLSVVNGQGVAQIANNRSGSLISGAQNVSTGGAINVVGGSTTTGSVNSGVFQNQTGTQGVSAGSITLQGATSGNNGGAFIRNTNGGGDQTIDVASSITITGGASGLANRAGIQTNGNQTITGNADILLTGGSSGQGLNSDNTSNAAQISANAFGKTQTIAAHDITLNAGSGGTDTFAVITSNTQKIVATGDVRITGGAAGGDSNGARIGAPGSTTVGSDIALSAHDIVLTGGTSSSGAAIGLSGNSPDLPSKIKITATGDVVLNSGTGSGSRIGAPNGSAAGGDIEVNAVNIALNGGAHQTAIRTTGNVTLNAGGSISEGANGAILATGLTLTAGSATLGGPNQIGSLNVPLRASPPNAPGVTGAFVLNNTGDLGVSSLRVGGALTLTDNGTVTLTAAGTQDAIVASVGGQTINASGLSVHAQDGRIAAINNTSGNQSLVIGTGGINLDVTAGSGVAQIANNRGAVTGGTQTVQTTGTLNVVGGSTTTGSVNSGIFQNQTGKQTVGAASIFLQAANAPVNSGGAFITNTSGGATSDQEIDVASGTISVAAGGVGLSNRAGISTNGNQTINGNADIFLTGGSSGAGLNANNTNNQAFISANGAGKSQTINARNITLNAGTGGNDTAATITSNTQSIMATGDVRVTGGSNTGDSNGARIGAPGSTTTGTNLTLRAHNVTLTGGTTSSGAAIGNSQNSPGLPSSITITASGDVAVNSGDGNGARIGAPKDDAGAGSINISASGDIALNGGAHDASIRTAADVTLSARNVTETANGQILANSLSLTASGYVDLGGTNTIAKIANLGAGGTLNFNDIGALTLDATSQDAKIRSSGGQMITAGGLVLHAENGHVASITNTAGDQNLFIGAGGIDLSVVNGQGVAQISNNSGSGAQNVQTPGTINVVGGSTTVGFLNSGIFQNQSGKQTVSAGSIFLQGAMAPVSTGGAFISNTGGGGDQEIDVASGTISVAAGSIGFANRAGISSNGNQTINGNADIVVSGGSSGTGAFSLGTSNSANIVSGAAKSQTINARSITLNAGTGGNDTFATIVGGTQNVSATGDVVLNGGGGTGVSNGARIGGTTATNLTLSAHNVTLNGGTTTGVGLGSSSSGTAQPNTIKVNASGDVVLNAADNGTAGARIGSSAQTGTAGGDIQIGAGGNIALNGAGLAAAIRTLGNATLKAGGSISENPNGLILANTLTTTSGASTLLGGPNQVSAFNATSGADVLLTNTGLLNVTGLSAAGNATLDNTGSLTISGSWTAGGTTSITAHSDVVLQNLLTGSNVVLNATSGSVREEGGGAIAAGSLATTSVGDTLLGGANQVSSFTGTSGGGMTLANTGDLTVAGINAGGVLTLVNAGAVSINASGTSDAIVSSLGGQTINADGLLVHVQDGRLARIINNGGAQVIGVGGAGINLEVVDGGGSAQIVNARGTVTNGTQDVSTTGLLSVVGGSTSNGSGAFNSGVFQAQTGKQTVTAGSITLQAAVAAVSTGGALIINTDGGSNSDQQVNVATGTIRLTGGGIGFNNRAGIQTSGNQTITGNADIFVTGGSSGSGTSALGTANSGLITAGKTQTINAHDITVNAGAGGSDTFAIIIGPTQSVNATGDVVLNGGGGSGTSNGARIGGTTATNLTLNAHNVTLNAGATTGIGLGSSSSGTAQPNTITVNATGDVALNAGSSGTAGARIGSSAQTAIAGGNIAVNAGGNIALNGAGLAAAIRTLGDVTLHAGGAISENTNGLIIANALGITSGGSTLLGGVNQISSLNVPLLMGSVPGVAGNFTLNNTGALAISSLRAGGNINLTNAGAITLNASGTQDARITSVGGQTISADSLTLHAQDGRVANITNTGGDQNLFIGTGGITLDVLNGTGVAQIVNNAGSGAQNVQTTGALTVVGGSALPSVNSGLFQNQSGKQTVSAASITLQGALSGSNGGALISNTAGGGDQEVDVFGGAITVSAGANGSVNRAGIVTAGDQTINGNPNIVLTGGASGGGTSDTLTSNGAFITAATLGRTQTIYAGDITLNAGAGGSDTFAAITGSNQIINANDVTLNGGGGFGNFNGARIGGPGGSAIGPTNLMLYAHNVTLNGGTTTGVGLGSTGFGPVLSNTITVNAIGDVALNSGSGAGARIGSGPNGVAGGDITISANGNIALNGTDRATSIRTTGDVTLNAFGSITEDVNGSILANGLTVNSSGATLLGGPNQVATFNGWSNGDLLLNNAGVLMVNGLQAAGDATLTNAGTVSITGQWNSAGAFVTTTGAGSDLDVTGQVLATGPMTVNVAGGLNVSAAGGGPVGVGLSSNGSQTINAGSLSLTSQDGGSVTIDQFGSGLQSITVNGGSVDVQTLGASGDASIQSGGSQTINVVNGDHFTLNALGGSASAFALGGPQTVSLTGSGRNALTVGSAGALGSSRMVAPVQSITAGGTGEMGSITIVGSGNGGTGLFTSVPTGASQTISTSGAMNIIADDGFVQLVANGGQSVVAQSLTLTAQNGGNAALFNSGGDQTVAVGSGGIHLEALGGSGTTSISNVRPSAPGVATGVQTVQSSGDLTMLGGSTSSRGSGSSISQSQTGAQTVTAANIALRAADTGNNGSAFISSSGGGDQVIHVADGTLTVSGGSAGFGNRAGISTNGNQTIGGNADIIVTGGAGGGGTFNGTALSNAALITASAVGKTQTINAHNITINAGAGGSDTFAIITGPTQVVNATGDVVLNGGGGSGTANGARIGGTGATNLVLNARSVILNGGTTTGVGLGSSSTAALPNTITVNATGDVVLNGGASGTAGARIGSSAQTATTGGSIGINAGGNIALNGGALAAAIRTLGNATLQAGGTISENANGLVVANALTTSSGGSTLLGGPNSVSSFAASAGGDVLLNNTSALLSLGSMSLPAALTVTQAGDLAIGSASALAPTAVYAAGPIAASASGAMIVRGSDSASGAASSLVSGDAVDIQAASLSLLGGASPNASALVSGSNINVTLGSFLTINGGSGVDSFARIQTLTSDGITTLYFPNLSSGGYAVDGFADTSHGPDGLFAGSQPATLGQTLLLKYGF